MTCEKCQREDPYAWFLCSACWQQLPVRLQIDVAIAYESRLSNPEKFQAWKDHALRTIKGKPFPVYAKL